MMKIAVFGDTLTRGRPGNSTLTLLHERLSRHYVQANFGWVNDAVIDLHRRLLTLPFEELYDIAFPWMGKNDVAIARGRQQIDRRATSRGPHRTVDAMALKIAGLELAAEAVAQVSSSQITQTRRRSCASGQ